MDVDVGLSRDPRPYLRARQAHADVLVSLNYPQPMVNSGFLFAQSGRSATRKMFRAWAAKASSHMCKGWECGDQEMLQEMLRAHCGWDVRSKMFMTTMGDVSHQTVKCHFPPPSPSPPLLSAAVPGTGAKENVEITIATLPPRKFASGKSEVLMGRKNANPISFHANFFFSNTTGAKAKRLRSVTASGVQMWCLGVKGLTGRFAKLPCLPGTPAKVEGRDAPRSSRDGSGGTAARSRTHSSTRPSEGAASSWGPAQWIELLFRRPEFDFGLRTEAIKTVSTLLMWLGLATGFCLVFAFVFWAFFANADEEF